MSEELKQFNINIDEVKPSEELFDNIREAIDKMRLATFKNNFEVVLNNNLIECKEIKTQFRTILGCRISYDNLDKNISFIVREDTKPSYEELEQQLKDKDEKISKVIEYINHPDFIDWHIGVDEGLYRRKDVLEILESNKED